MRKLPLIVMALALVGMACACPNLAGIQSTLGVVQQTVVKGITEIPQTVESAATSIGTLEAGGTKPAGTGNGTIRGHLIYPASVIVAQRIIAFKTGTMSKAAEVSTVQGQATYELSVPAGEYYVVAYTLDGKLAAGYSKAVPCGLAAGCKDHTLIAIKVKAGEVVENINPQDWYAPAGAFPPMP
ncbi:MAG: hypothetical protein ABSC61_12285 [Anaerolineales bacterium]